MRRAVSVTAILFIVLLLEPLNQFEVVKASTEGYASKESDYVSISIIQPKNITYDTNDIQMTLVAEANPGIWYVGYSLDGQPLVEITPQNWSSGHTFNETLQLNNLSNGSHVLVAEAKAPAVPNDILTATSNLTFTVFAVSPTPTPVPELSWLTIVPLLLSVFSVAILFRHQTTNRSRNVDLAQ